MTQPGLLDSELDRQYKRLDSGVRRGRRVAAFRLILAYALKLVAAGSGLIVAFDWFPHLDRAFGVAAVLAVFVDTITQNYTRLVSTTKAGNAFYFLKDKVHAEYNLALGTIIAPYQSSGAAMTEEANEKILALKQATLKELATSIREIEMAEADQRLKALEALSLDAERAAAEAKLKTG